VEFLEFKNDTISQNIISILRHWVSLKELTIECVTWIFLLGADLESENERVGIRKMLKNPSKLEGWLPSLTVLRLRLFQTMKDFTNDMDITNLLDQILGKESSRSWYLNPPTANEFIY
jgi:hypothetical protein